MTRTVSNEVVEMAAAVGVLRKLLARKQVASMQDLIEMSDGDVYELAVAVLEPRPKDGGAR